MSPRSSHRIRCALALLATAFAAAACEYLPPAAEAQLYEGCLGEYGDEPDVCADGISLCLGSPTRELAGVCSVECSSDFDCPSLKGERVVCERFAAGGQQMCVVRCDPDASEDRCPSGTECMDMEEVSEEHSVGLCMPVP